MRLGAHTHRWSVRSRVESSATIWSRGPEVSPPKPDPVSTIKLTADDLADIMDTAGMACTYWADEIEVDGDSVRVLDADGIDHDTDKTSIEKAFTLIAEGRIDLWGEIRRYVESAIAENDLSWIDSYAADALLQVACFGEIIYG